MEPHFQTPATRSRSIEGTKTTAALPLCSECTKEPFAGRETFGSTLTAGAVAKLRNILHEKITGRGASGCLFGRRLGKKRVFVGDAAQVEEEGQN